MNNKPNPTDLAQVLDGITLVAEAYAGLWEALRSRMPEDLAREAFLSAMRGNR